MKKLGCIWLSIVLTLGLVGCGGDVAEDSVQSQTESLVESVASEAVSSVESSETTSAGASESPAQTEQTASSEPEEDAQSKVAVVYFSATGNTKTVANLIAAELGADMYEIVPEVAYSSDDLNYSDDSCRANQEMDDETARPAISSDLSAVTEYDIIFLGHPIWWGTAPRIIQTFLETYDVSGATIYTFCTSGGSGIERSVSDLQSLYTDLNIVSGRRFSGASDEDVSAWIEELGVRELLEQEAVMGETTVTSVYAHIGDEVLEIELADNSSAEAFVELLEEGDVTIDMHDYGSFEKVGSIGTTLPRNDEDITTVPGDVILYQGSNITIYYDTNTWDFTRLGKVKDLSQEELKEVLGDGDVTVVFSLT